MNLVALNTGAGFLNFV